MINRVVLVGRLTRDPELRYTPSGVAVATFTLAVNRTYKNAQGEREADFINIVVWRQLAELCANYLKKGRQAAVDGRLQTRSYENNEGRKVYVTEVVAENVQFLDSAQSGSYSGPTSAGQGMDPMNPRTNQGSHSYQDPFADESQPIDISDDDLPF
ncbi:single-stranded DNA-binding protein [Rubeoparvulum massiliense]|uniref:single-stranded DNA-binding protein n=1 Tax=Rubeoparvulum massiliense TaxID=1631346 RepID=UPI00065E2420|nr:single-stranded DNA-binding protein [Rubeoparvulum massiliense]